MDRFSKLDQPSENDRQSVNDSTNQKEFNREEQTNLSVFDDVEISQEVGISPPGFSKRTVRTSGEKPNTSQDERKTAMDKGDARIPTRTKMGVASIVVSILSFFLFPFILAPIGIVLGIFALRNDDRSGWYGIGIGSVVLLLTVLIFPLTYGRL